MKYYVWCSGLCDTHEFVEATSHRDAVAVVGRMWKAHHHGEIMHVNVQMADPYTSTRRYFVRFKRDGWTEFLPR